MPDTLPTFVDDRRRLRLIEALRAGSVVITANSRAARWLVARAEDHYVAAQPLQGWATPQAEAFRAFCQRRFAEAQASGLTSLALLNAAQQKKLWRRLCGSSSLAASSLSAWRRLHEYEIDLHHPLFGRVDHERQSDEVANASLLFKDAALRYRALLRKNQWIDEAMLPAELGRIFALDPTLAPRHVILYGYEELTPQLTHFAESLRALGGAVELFAEAAPTAPRRCIFDDASAELDAAACWARAHIEANPAARIGVICSDLNQSRSAVERIFLRRLEPERFLVGSARRSFEISLGPALGVYAMIRSALLALRWSREAIGFDAVREFMLSPYMLGGMRTLAARAAWMRRAAEYAPEPLSLDAFLALCARRELAPLASAHLVEAWRNFARLLADDRPLRWREQMLRVSRALSALGWPNDNEPGRGFSSLEHQTWRRWEESCRALASLDLVSGGCQLDEVLAAMDEACAAPFAPENVGAPVQILGEDEAAGSCFDAVWICGMSEDWPPQPALESMLPRALQAAAGVSAADDESSSLAIAALFARLCASADEIVCSHHASEDAGELRPSPLLAALPEIAVAASPHAWSQTPVAECEQIAEARAPLGHDEKRQRGVKVLELQSACPFHAFAEARLGVDDDEAANVGLRPFEHGRLIEAALEAIWKKLQTRAELERAHVNGELSALIVEAVEQASGASLYALGGDFSSSVRRAELQRAADLIHAWLQVELRRADFAVEAHQIDLELELPTLLVKGRSDRVDRLASGGVAIIDYKASDKYKAAQWSDKKSATARPQRLQMPLYALALDAEDRRVEALAYALVDRREMSFNGQAADTADLAKPKGRRARPHDSFAEWRATLERLAADFVDGRAEVDPKSPPPNRNGSCNHCPCEPLCRVAEIDFVAEEEEADDERA